MANHSVIYDAQIIGIHETDNGRVTIDLYCASEGFPEQRFYPAVLENESAPEKRRILIDLEKIGPDEVNNFLIEDFSGVSRKTGRAFRICKFISLFQVPGEEKKPNLKAAGNDV